MLGPGGVKRLLLWAISGVLFAMLLSLMLGGIAGLVSENSSSGPFGSLVGGATASLGALLLLMPLGAPVYLAGLALWLAFAHRVNDLEQTWPGLLGGLSLLSLILAVPFALALSELPYWYPASLLWTAVVVPRVAIPSLHPADRCADESEL